MKVLVTGGAGYIGSHTCVELMQAGTMSSFSTTSATATQRRIGRICADRRQNARIHQADVRDSGALREVFARHRFDAVIHFAGLKAVGESVEKPDRVLRQQRSGRLGLLCRAMAQAGSGCWCFPRPPPSMETQRRCRYARIAASDRTNPYGHYEADESEGSVQDLEASDRGAWRIALLRYFNPVGAHRVADRRGPAGHPNNLMPNIASSCCWNSAKKFACVWPGDLSDARPVTGVRDYIHVVDLGAGPPPQRWRPWQRERRGLTVNLGTGRGVSVLETVRAFERASGRAVPFERVARRAGDVAECYADPSLAEKYSAGRRHTLSRTCAAIRGAGKA